MGKKKSEEKIWLTLADTPNELPFFKKRRCVRRLQQSFISFYVRHEGRGRNADGTHKNYARSCVAPWQYSQVKLSVDEIDELVKRTYSAGFDDIGSMAELLKPTPVSSFKTQVLADDGQGLVDAVFVRNDSIEETTLDWIYPEDGVSSKIVLTPIVDVYMDYHCLDGEYLLRIMRVDIVIGGEIKFVTIFTDMLASRLGIQADGVPFCWRCQEQGSSLLRTYLAVQFAALNGMLAPTEVRNTRVPREDKPLLYVPKDVQDYALNPKYLVQTPKVRAKKQPVVLYKEHYRPKKEG